ncbi:MAG: PH domain-containing protein [Ruminococcaceae bacterium]|nr:PH domain-containing protein [Oscillospiraceae bacterium]
MAIKDTVNYTWQDRKRIIFGLPWSFTKYYLTEDKLLIRKGFLNTQEEEVRLYRIMDVTLKRSFGERLFGLGTIHCCSADKSTPEFDILHVKNSRYVKDLLSDEVERERNERRVGVREYMESDIDEIESENH